jgi:hypothetical protein
MSMLDRLPHELLEDIIDILQADSYTREFRVHPYALVSRQFRTLCQKRIFASIDLRPGPETPGSSSYTGLQQFRRFTSVVSQNPTLGSYVRELQLVYPPSLDNNEPNGEELYGMLRFLDNVLELTLGFVEPARGNISSWKEHASLGLRKELALFAQRNPIAMLVIFGIYNVSPGFLRQFGQLRSFTGFFMKDTTLSSAAQDEDDEEESAPWAVASHSRVCLDKLALGQCDTATFEEGFFLHPSSVFDISQITELMLDDQRTLCSLLPFVKRLEVLNMELASQCSFPLMPR